MRYLLPIALSLAAAAGHAAGSCKPVLDAMTRYVGTPSHRMSAEAAETDKTINTGARCCLWMRGQWRVGPSSEKERLRQSQDNAGDSECPVLREDAFDGESASVYPVVNENTGTGEWSICKRSGLRAKAPAAIGRCASITEQQQAPVVGP